MAAAKISTLNSSPKIRCKNSFSWTKTETNISIMFPIIDSIETGMEDIIFN
jgi:hypothetical protein